jgi:hypothetical protein
MIKTERKRRKSLLNFNKNQSLHPLQILSSLINPTSKRLPTKKKVKKMSLRMKISTQSTQMATMPMKMKKKMRNMELRIGTMKKTLSPGLNRGRIGL